ncbi:hypothetical protein BJY04DRAFT_196557 [Aspergillus karnatakaensis]|uniref:uncharacterized protein n=1 Tax=Aspergillus karnatakaensis TaxID=1810916 RepID=UPI003CCCDF2C
MVRIRSQRLADIVAGCKSLRCFSYVRGDFYINQNKMDTSPHFKPAQLVSVLSSQKEHLETIRCTIDWEDAAPVSWDSCPKIGSLAAFSKLTYLSSA